MTRKFSLVVALSLTTAIVPPSRAEAAVLLPALGFVQGAAAGLFGSAVLGGQVLAPGFISGVIGSTYLTGSIAGRLLLTLASNAILGSLFRPRTPTQEPSEQFRNFSQSITPMERGYGEVKKGGPMGFRSGIKDEKRHWTVTIASHPTEGPQRHFLDLREVTVDGNGDVQTEPLDGFVNLRTYTGGASQATDPTLLSTFAGITAAHKFTRHSYAALWAKQPPQQDALKIYSQGAEPQYAPVWRMWNEIYDPRDQSTGYSNNWALCFAHELVNVWGLSVDWDRVGEEADICDALVTNRSGGTQKTWTFNHVFKSNVSFADVVAEFLGVADGMIWQRVDGKVDFYAGRWIAPTLTLGPDDFLAFTEVRGDFGLQPPTEFFAEYREPANEYRETPTAPYVVDATAPTRNAPQLRMHGADSHNQALRAIKPIALANRAASQYRARIGAAVLEVIGGRDKTGDTTGAGGLAHRFVTIDHPTLDAPVTCEVKKLEANPDHETGEIELIISTAADRSFDAATEEPAPPSYNNADVAGDDPIATVTDLDGDVTAGPGGLAQIRYFWTAADASLTPILYITQGSTPTREIELAAGASEYIDTGLISGATYTAQIRLRTAGFSLGDLTPDPALSRVAEADSTPPAVHAAGPTVTLAGTTAAVAWTAPNDTNYFGTNVYRADYAPGYAGAYDFADASLVHFEYGLSNAADDYDDTGLAAGVYAYWIIPINAAGSPGPTSGPADVTVT